MSFVLTIRMSLFVWGMTLSEIDAEIDFFGQNASNWETVDAHRQLHSNFQPTMRYKSKWSNVVSGRQLFLNSTQHAVCPKTQFQCQQLCTYSRHNRFVYQNRFEIYHSLGNSIKTGGYFNLLCNCNVSTFRFSVVIRYLYGLKHIFCFSRVSSTYLPLPWVL